MKFFPNPIPKPFNFFSIHKSLTSVCVSVYLILANKAKKQLVYPSKANTQAHMHRHAQTKLHSFIFKTALYTPTSLVFFRKAGWDGVVS